MKKIICIGNRFIYPDNFGIKIYEKLKQNAPKDIDVIEGGLGGLNLALHFETDEPVLVVDHGVGFEKRLFFLQELSTDFIKEYNHKNAFYYLLKTLQSDKKKNIWIYLSNNPKWEEKMLDRYCYEILEGIKRV